MNSDTGSEGLRAPDDEAVSILFGYLSAVVAAIRPIGSLRAIRVPGALSFVDDPSELMLNLDQEALAADITLEFVDD